MSELFDKIKEAKEVLGDTAAEIIATGYPLENWSPEKGSAKSIFNVNDNTPSMMWNKKEYYFKDFSTGKTFGLIDYFMIKNDESYMKAVRRMLDLAKIEYNPKLFNPKDDDKDNWLKNYVYPKEEIRKIDGTAKAYMIKRGISEKTMQYVDLRMDAYNNVAYQLRDLDGKIIGVKYRPSHALRADEPKMFWQKNASSCHSLYNMDKVDVTKPLLIVEGYNDCLACIEAGYTNVVSIPGGADDDNWIRFNYSWLEQFEEITLWFDNDNAGDAGTKKVLPRLGEYRCKIVKPLSEDEDAVEKYYHQFTESVIRKTDANNCLLGCGASRVLAMINNAEEIPLENIVDLMDAEEFDIEKTGYIPSGISSFDREIYGFVDGTLNIWTALTGVGKSTILSQSCVLEAIDRGEKVYWFNAELSCAQMLNWIISQAAGRYHTIEYTSPNGFNYYKVTPQAIQAIKEYYRNRVFVYDNLLLSSADDVFDTMEYTYRKRGAKVFVIDNWMCMNFKGQTNEEITGKQVDFINKLIHFCKKNQVEVHIVAHPRKLAVGETLNEYSILGSSSFVNMADRIFGLDKARLQPLVDDGFDRQLMVFKDRTLGTKGATVGLYYDRATRRLFDNNIAKMRRYSWDDRSINYDGITFANGGKIIGDRLLSYEQMTEHCPY